VPYSKKGKNYQNLNKEIKTKKQYNIKCIWEDEEIVIKKGTIIEKLFPRTDNERRQI